MLATVFHNAAAFGLGYWRYKTTLRHSPCEAEIIALLRRTMIRAQAASPFYRDEFRKANFDPQQFKSLAQIHQIPLVTKEQIRANHPKIRTDQGYFVRDYRTSGSTGKPLVYAKSLSNIAWEYAFHLQYFAEGKAGVGDRMIAVRTYVPKGDQPLWKKDPLFPVLWMSAYHLSHENIPAYIEALRSYKADYIRGYPSSLYILALGCRNLGIKLSFKAAFASSETLPTEYRKTIEEVFNCRVLEYYGLSENVVAGSHCAKGDLFHPFARYGYWEVLKPDLTPAGPGESGVIVGTGFNNPPFPFIRYWTGDIATVARRPCACGFAGMAIERIAGREDDILMSSDGRPLPGVNFYSVFREYPDVEQFQLVQTHAQHVDVRIVAPRGIAADTRQRLTLDLRARLGAGMGLAIEELPALPRNAIGKIRNIVRLSTS